ncbi:MAG: hypothetical protein IPM77_13920 [Crocinitomicaceae bacterium]|nr:hypothetical protein [Crocinitomicaceae bacterium]
MKTQLISLILFLTGAEVALAQGNILVGAEVNTSFHLNSHRNKGTKIWSSESGYGFSAGVPLMFVNSDTRRFITGIQYEYVSFDNWANNQLVASTRFHSVHIPLGVQFDIMKPWYYSLGTGMNYNFRSRTFSPGNNVDISNSANPLQPYISAGLGSMVERGTGVFDLGIQIRYHFLDMWRKTYPVYAATSSKVISLDLMMRFYF